jgi:toxin ParE1/3/4
LTRTVTFRPLAEADLFELYDFIAGRESPARAFNYVERIEAACLQLGNFPERGQNRPDLYPGLRIVGFENRISIAFLVEETSVRIVRVLYGGRLFPDDCDV